MAKAASSHRYPLDRGSDTSMTYLMACGECGREGDVRRVNRGYPNEWNPMWLCRECVDAFFTLLGLGYDWRG